MGDGYIIPPAGADDTEGARRVFEEFFAEYQPVFTSIEAYLEKTMTEVSIYAEAYRPWQKALREVARGIHLINKHIPLPHPKSFVDALRMFSFEGSVNFLEDICISCNIPIGRNWAERFRKHVEMLLFAYSILSRQNQLQPQHQR